MNYEEVYHLFDSGIFNSITKGFVLMSMDEMDVDRNTKCNILMKLSELFDDVYAEDAEEYYRNWR